MLNKKEKFLIKEYAKKLINKRKLTEDGDNDLISRTLDLIKTQVGLDLKLDTHFSGIEIYNKRKYFNVILKQRVSESDEYNALKRFADKYKSIQVTPNGVNRLAIFPLNISETSKINR